MTRKLKMVGALAVAVVMFSLTASLASATHTSAKYPATGSATSTADKFDLFGSTVSCTNNTFTGSLAAASTTVTVTPVYKSCTAFGLPATVNFTGCDGLVHNAAGASALTVDLVCPAGKSVDVTIYSSSAHTTAICHVTVTPFTGKGGLSATNNGSHINVTGAIDGIVAHQSRTNFLCPAGTEDKAVKYTVQAAGITVSGNNGALSVS